MENIRVVKMSKLCIGCRYNDKLNYYKPCDTCINNEKYKGKKNILVKTQFGTFRKQLINYYNPRGY